MEAKRRARGWASRHGAFVLCAFLLLFSALPLYLISFYNHPYYDDFGFSAGVHQTWQSTGSLSRVCEKALESAAEVRSTWQGTYTGTLLSNIQPGVFSEKLYFLGTFFLLTAFLACFLIFFQTVFPALGLTKEESGTLGCLTLTLLLQFMPDTGEAFFWFNGGVGNLFIYALLALSAALLLRLARANTRGQTLGLTAALAVLMVALGGGSYGGGLFGLCLLALATAWLFWKKQPKRWIFAGLLGLFLICFLYSVVAPGNGVRAGVIGYQSSPVKAVVQSFYQGAALIGGWLKLPLLGVTVALWPFLWRAAKNSSFSFRRPWAVILLFYCLFCVQLTPPLYSIAGIGGGRIEDTYWISFVVFWLLSAYEIAGFLARRPTALPEGRRRRAAALLGAGMLVVGGLGYKQPEDRLYGLQNLQCVSAALSLVSGEAARYDQEMTAREELLNDPSQPSVTLSPLTASPKVFMEDLLIPGAVYDVRPSLCLYYQKTSISIRGEEAKP